jgi:anaerobic ribonucleoside-triphosphate reductase
MINVIKRDGQVAEFNLKKISEAITKAFKATEKFYTEEIVGLLSLRVTSDFQNKIKDELIHVEDVQDSVENVL